MTLAATIVHLSEGRAATYSLQSRQARSRRSRTGWWSWPRRVISGVSCRDDAAASIRPDNRPKYTAKANRELKCKVRAKAPYV